MGGSGSGNWYRWQGKKSTVEESTVLSMQMLRKRLFQGSRGSFTWTWTGGHQASISYYVIWNESDPTITLEYRWRDTESITIPVRLEMTPTEFGGRRWWFTCPLIVGGRACDRRAGKLYLPPGAKYFGCRKCHDLSYVSSQESHQAERVFGRLGLDPAEAKLLGSKRAWTDRM